MIVLTLGAYAMCTQPSAHMITSVLHIIDIVEVISVVG